MKKFLDALFNQIMVRAEGFNLMKEMKSNLTEKEFSYVQKVYFQMLRDDDRFSGNQSAPLLPFGTNRKASSGVKFTTGYASKMYHRRQGKEWSGSPYGHTNSRYLVDLLHKLQERQKFILKVKLVVTATIGAGLCLTYLLLSHSH